MGCFNYFEIQDAYGHLPKDIPAEKVQQCTGLVDAKGRELYEGDLVEFDNSDWDERVVKGVAEVIFCRDLLLVETPGYGLWFRDGFHPSLRGRFVVIGNIFENPEMMDGAIETKECRREKR